MNIINKQKPIIRKHPAGQATAKVKNLVLIGGGHSHAITLKLLAMKPLPSLRLILISDCLHTPYSGMLPGYLAGFYSFEETHIDLPLLCQGAQAEFAHTQAIGLDLINNQVICANLAPIPFDYLSIDIGSTPEKTQIIGAEYTIPAKPVSNFLRDWNRILKETENHPEKSLTLNIIGGGAGGVELALNMQSRLLQIIPKNQLVINLFHRSNQLLPQHNSWVSSRLYKILSQRDINLYLEENVKEVLPDKIVCDSGLSITGDHHTFLVTHASAPDWIKKSGLTTDEKGFILVNNYLQSISHSHVFAAGDIATMVNHVRPKSGVFAVRQGKPLFENLQRAFLGTTLKPYIPQKLYLNLLGTGDKKAIASWGCFGWESPCLWHWKDYLDRQFMQSLLSIPVD